MNDLIKNVHPVFYLLAVAYAVWFTAWVSIIISYIRYFNEVGRLMRTKTLNKNRSDTSRLMGGALYSKLGHGVEIFDSTTTTSLSKSNIKSKDTYSNILWARKQAARYLPNNDLLFFLGIYQLILVSILAYICFYLLPSIFITNVSTSEAIMPGYMSMTKLVLLLCPALMIVVVAPFVLMRKEIL